MPNFINLISKFPKFVSSFAILENNVKYRGREKARSRFLPKPSDSLKFVVLVKKWVLFSGQIWYKNGSTFQVSVASQWHDPTQIILE